MKRFVYIGTLGKMPNLAKENGQLAEIAIAILEARYLVKTCVKTVFKPSPLCKILHISPKGISLNTCRLMWMDYTKIAEESSRAPPVFA